MFKRITLNYRRLSRLDEMQGAGEERSESYREYGERVPEPATQQFAKSVSGVSGKARKQDRATRKSAGDTIVEVMIATAIIAAVLGGAYAIASRALRSGRIAQERIEALKLAEGQVERLKFESKVNSGFDATYRASNYCLSADASGNTVKNQPNNPGSGVYHASCKSSFYKINISYVIVDHSIPNKFLGTYSVRITWDRIGGGQEELILNYQI